MKKALLLSLALVLAVASGAWAQTVLNSSTSQFVSVANTGGVLNPDYDASKYGTSANDNQYYYLFTGGGLNALHITTSTSASSGQVTALPSTTGSDGGQFFISDTGGSGYFDDAIVMVAISGPIASNFSVNINGSGYSWTPNASSSSAPTTYSYVTNSLGTQGATFGSSSLIYGGSTQFDKLSGGTASPFYSGQPGTTGMTFMFIDLGLGVAEPGHGTFTSSMTNLGDVLVNYQLNNIAGDTVAFDVYAWSADSNTGEGINWTNPTASGDSYEITDTSSPVPVPPSLFLLAGGLGGIGMLRRRWVSRRA